MDQRSPGRSARRIARAVATVVLLAACSSEAGVRTSEAPAPSGPVPAADAVLADAGWPEVAAWITAAGAATGEPILVNAFASWCVPCEEELPVLVALADELDDVTFLGVNHEDGRAAGQAMMDRLGVDYATVFDRDGEVVRAVGGRSMPTTALFSPSGELLQIREGGVTREELLGWIRASR